MSLDYGADIVYKRLLFSWALTLTRGKRDNSLVSRTCSQVRRRRSLSCRSEHQTQQGSRSGQGRKVENDDRVKSLFKMTDICLDYDMISNA